MKKSMFFSLILLFAIHSLFSQIYHNEDKEALRVFLRQPSAISGEINAERLGLTISDTATWYADENWIINIKSCVLWNNDVPKRVDTIKVFSCRLAGDLNACKWSKITYLDCAYNQLTSLDVSTCLNLITLSCNTNQLTSLDVSGCPNLAALSCDNNKIQSLDLSSCPNLRHANCYTNQLSSLDISGCLNLYTLRCHNNQLKNILDLSNRLELSALSCSNNQLRSVNVTACSELYTLYCANNQLTDIDISDCSRLWGLNCSNNQLQTLDLSGSPDLDNFNCSNNRLQHLDISGCLKLYEYNCHNNQLPLSVLFSISSTTTTTWQINKKIGTQNLAPQRVLLGDSLFSDQSSFIINNNALYTEYTVNQNDSAAPISSYSVNEGILVFHDTGVYTVKMSNMAIISDYAHPAEVIIELTVIEAYNTDACLSDISLSAGTLNPAFDCSVSDYAVEVANNIDTIHITATTRCPYASVSGDGLHQLIIGNNYFTITVIAEDGITMQEYFVTVNRSSVDVVENQHDASLWIYPNPTTGELTIESGEMEFEHIELYDITGKVVKAYNSLSDNTINVSKLPSGIYFIALYSEGKKVIKKFVKQ